MKILFVSLGCDKNLVDSEEMLGDLTQAGYEITDDEEAAEAAIVNTCCFINDAKKESIDSILELAPRRTGGQLKALVVTGCLAQRYSEEIRKEIPEVDAIIGTTAQETLLETLEEVLRRKGQDDSRAEREALSSGEGGQAEPAEIPEQDAALVRLNDLKRMPRAHVNRVLTTASGSGYLRIAEGCSKYCTYCVIPSIRGPYRSLPMEQILKTAEDLAAQGVTFSYDRRRIIDGVDLDITEREMERINRNMEAARAKFEAMGYSAAPLTQSGERTHLNGVQALYYARIRKLDSDFRRTDRQRRLLRAMQAKIRANLWNPVMLYRLGKAALGSVRTNMSVAQLLSLGAKALADPEPGTMQIPVDGTYTDDGSRLNVDDWRSNIEQFRRAAYGRTVF